MQWRTLTTFFGLLASAMVLSGCNVEVSSHVGDDISEPPDKRSYYMGFTPWPYDNSLLALNNTYSLIQSNGDIVAHHLMEGIPWQEAYSDALLPSHVEQDISTRVNQTLSSEVVYLAIDSLNSARDDLAPNWGEDGSESRPAPWHDLDFDDLEVAQAYSRFAIDMIDRFHPSYFNYAPEISELILNDPVKFSRFKVFSQRVYQTIKQRYPSLPLMVSVALKSPDSIESTIIRSNFEDISDYIDMVGVSAYPYAFYDHDDKGNPDKLPEDWLSQIKYISGNKPIAVTETGWIAGDLVIPNFSYSEASDVYRQRDYTRKLLKAADDLDMAFVIWFSIVDYDALWNGLLDRDDLSKLWKDTGLYDEQLNARPALEIWKQYYDLDRE